MGLTRSIWKCNLGCKSKYGKYLWFKHPQDLVDHYDEKHPLRDFINHYDKKRKKNDDEDI